MRSFGRYRTAGKPTSEHLVELRRPKAHNNTQSEARTNLHSSNGGVRAFFFSLPHRSLQHTSTPANLWTFPADSAPAAGTRARADPIGLHNALKKSRLRRSLGTTREKTPPLPPRQPFLRWMGWRLYAGGPMTPHNAARSARPAAQWWRCGFVPHPHTDKSRLLHRAGLEHAALTATH